MNFSDAEDNDDDKLLWKREREKEIESSKT